MAMRVVQHGHKPRYRDVDDSDRPRLPALEAIHVQLASVEVHLKVHLKLVGDAADRSVVDHKCHWRSGNAVASSADTRSADVPACCRSASVSAPAERVVRAMAAHAEH